MIFLTVYYTSGLRRAGHDTGDWSNGMIGVSKTFGGSSILSSPAIEKPWKQRKIAAFKAFVRYARRATAVDTPGGRPPCLHERASDGQRSSSGNAVR